MKMIDFVKTESVKILNVMRYSSTSYSTVLCDLLYCFAVYAMQNDIELLLLFCNLCVIYRWLIESVPNLLLQVQLRIRDPLHQNLSLFLL